MNTPSEQSLRALEDACADTSIVDTLRALVQPKRPTLTLVKGGKASE